MNTITRTIPSATVGRSSLTLKLQALRDFLEHEALTNPLAARLLLEFGRQLGVAA